MKTSRTLKESLTFIIEATNLLVDYANREAGSSVERASLLSLSNITAAVLLNASANIAILELLEKEYDDAR